MLHKDEAVTMVDRKVAELMEHFDSVRIFVTKYDGLTRMTHEFQRAAGNHYASRGQVAEWLIKEDSISRREAVGGGDDEGWSEDVGASFD